MKWPKSCVITMLALAFWQGQAFSQQLIRGYIISAESAERLSMVNITIYPAGNRYISNRYGAFSLHASKTDTMQLSIIGYETLRMPLTKYVTGNIDTIVRIYMQPVTYKLNPVDVRRKKNDSLARHYARVLQTDSTLNNYDKIKYWPKAMNVEFSNGLILRGPITALWYKYSDRGQEIARTLELVRLYQLHQKATEKYNIAFIQRITGLDENDSETLMNRCRISDEFVLHATEYDLGMAVKRCMKEGGGK